MRFTTDDCRSSSMGLDLTELLRKPITELLGVTQQASVALGVVGVRTIFDLGTSRLFATAQEVADIGRLGTMSFRFGLATGDLLTDEARNTPLANIPELSIDRLRDLTPEQARDLSAALDVATIRDLALWPPYRAAHRLIGEAAGSTLDSEELQTEELRPRLGEYPTERVYYTSLVMLHMEGQSQQNQLTDAVSLDPVVQTPGGFNRPAIGALLTFSQSWFSQGITLGHMLHSLALAPGEATRIAIIDWSRRTRADSTESISEAEQLDNSTLHNRAVSEVQSAVARDFQQGGSRSSSSSSSESRSDAVSVGTGWLTSFVASGDASSTSQSAQTSASAESSSWSLGNRSVLAQMTQNVNDRTEQHSTSVRNRRASAVREVSQTEHEQVSTRVVANYNHMHALTVQYYEVVQIYRTVAQLERADRVLFIPMQVLDFNPAKRDASMKVVDRFRSALIRTALNRQIRSLLIDDTTAVTIKPMAPVVVATTRPELRASIPRITGRALPITAAVGAVPATAGAAAEPPGRATTVSAKPMTFKLWNETAIAIASRVLDRPLIRVDSDDLHIPDNTELLAISFDGINVNSVILDHVGAEPGANQPFTVPSDQARIEIPNGIRFIDLDAILLSKSEADSRSGNMIFHCSYLGRRFSLPPIPIQLGPGTTPQLVVSFETDQLNRQSELLKHLQENREYYSQAVYRQLDSATLTMVLSRYVWNGRPLIDQVEPVPLTVAGNYLVMRAPISDSEDSGVPDVGSNLTWRALLDRRGFEFRPDQRLIPIPTAGVFAEAVLGRANSAEKLDITRFWNWQDSPIPLAPTEIAPVGTGTRATPEDLRPGQLSSPVLNIVNPTALPAPTGMDAVLTALTNLNFRDMSGLAGTVDLVKTGMQSTLAAATDAGELASANMKTEAQKAISMGQIAGDIAKSAIAAFTGKKADSSGSSSVQGISGDGARINHGRDMDKRGVPGPGTAGAAGATGAATAAGSGSSGADTGGSSAKGSGAGAGVVEEGGSSPAYSHESAYADKGAFGFSPDAVRATTSQFTDLAARASGVELVGYSPVKYNRNGALEYARKFWNKPCDDQFIGLNSGARKVPVGTKFVGSGVPGAEHAILPDGTTIPWADLFDCTHFISCCIGVRPGEVSGGIPIAYRQLGAPPSAPYGIVRVSTMVDYLTGRIRGSVQYAKLIAELSNDANLIETLSNKPSDRLQPGDLIAYYEKAGKRYGHLAMYLGENKIACHTSCRSDLPECTWDNDWKLGSDEYLWSVLHFISDSTTDA